ncbi:30S ribosomal protein THX [Photobacterium phosphoreum]|mgnify:FL=1|jgi:ribosomal small subunit protein bTHX|nr:30S ribosomal protein THX [Photobacterium phosphoreum]MCD9462609.1 30S ribosomal protein THX [Photobacterium phosphoreum]MCD9469149.1 30S ribosomal protein THX [Photobacterium phosphoreum]MCD9482024.1 30S ribosomal protein THX [Photobacterium phosphoreum]MCD9502425.1 30S ribosomal protein THX [Photobacterium phosphoreum]MCD9505637.1 30S ribosomal protein THX [Photobacterium phosphoreum]
MAKGDIKTTKGKRRVHSHGNARLTTEGKRKHHSA